MTMNCSARERLGGKHHHHVWMWTNAHPLWDNKSSDNCQTQLRPCHILMITMDLFSISHTFLGVLASPISCFCPHRKKSLRWTDLDGASAPRCGCSLKNEEIVAVASELVILTQGCLGVLSLFYLSWDLWYLIHAVGETGWLQLVLLRW